MLCCVQTGALLRAAHEGDLEKVSTLLQEGVPVDSENSVRIIILYSINSSAQGIYDSQI